MYSRSSWRGSLKQDFERDQLLSFQSKTGNGPGNHRCQIDISIVLSPIKFACHVWFVDLYI